MNIKKHKNNIFLKLFFKNFFYLLKKKIINALFSIGEYLLLYIILHFIILSFILLLSETKITIDKINYYNLKLPLRFNKYFSSLKFNFNQLKINVSRK